MTPRASRGLAALGCALALCACDPKEDATKEGEHADASAPDDGGSNSSPGGSSGSDDPTTTSGGGGSAGEGDDPGDEPSDAGDRDLSLDGEWEDNGRGVQVAVEDDGTVSGTYLQDVFCDRDHGSVPAGQEPEPGANVDSTRVDFLGALDHAGPTVVVGDVIRGDAAGGDSGLNTCRFGFDADSGVQNGFVIVPFWLEVIDADTLSGEWEADADADGETDTVPFQITRR